MRVSDVMTTNPITVSPDRAIRDALGLMVENAIRHLPVVEGDRLVGMLSDRDIRQSSLPLEDEFVEMSDTHARLDRKVSEIMTKEYLSVQDSDSVGVAIEMMVQERVGGIPVVAEGSTDALVGIISYVDILLVSKPLLENS